MKTIFLAIVIALSTHFSSAYAVSKDHGEKLHMKSCSGCHDSSVYTRQNRRVQSLPKLGSQVRFCKNNLGITWFDDEVEDVTHYLNKEYYKFK